MSEEIIIVDDFYDIPHIYHKGFYENKCLISEETVNKITQILRHPIEIIQASNESEDLPGVLAHLQSDWIAVIYLSLPVESFGEFGLKFYSHIETGLESFPSKEEMIKYKIDDLQKVFSCDLTLWKEYANITARYNRMVLFKSNRWHSYSSNNIKYQKLIIKNSQ